MDFSPVLLETLVENIFLYGFIFLLTLGIVITIHEFGHYIAARICGVHVETFAFGFGREAFGFGGGKFKTRWSICWLPIGGFVKLFGDVDPNNPVVWDHENDCKKTLNSEELKVAFCSKNVWQRIFIVAAGPAINIVLTFLIFYVAFITYGERSRPLIINALSTDSAANVAGIKLGDIILEMDGKKVRRLEDIYDFTIYENPPLPHSYKILRGDEIVNIDFTARRVKYTNKKGVEQHHGQTGMLHLRAVSLKDISSVGGVDTLDNPDKARSFIMRTLGKNILIGLPYEDDRNERVDPFLMTFPADLNTHLSDIDDEHYDIAFLIDPDVEFKVRLSPVEGVYRALHSMNKIIVNSYKLMSVAYKGKTDEPVIGGVSSISKHSANAAQAGFYDYMMFIAGFSLTIAFINLLPIPALDGGYLTFYVYEVITGRAVSAMLQNIAMIIGVVFLVGIMIYANVSDLITMLNSE